MNLSILKKVLLCPLSLGLALLLIASCTQKTDARYESLKTKKYESLSAPDKKYFTDQLTLKLQNDDDFKLSNKYLTDPDHRLKLMYYMAKYVSRYPELRMLDKPTRMKVMADASR